MSSNTITLHDISNVAKNVLATSAKFFKRRLAQSKISADIVDTCPIILLRKIEFSLTYFESIKKVSSFEIWTRLFNQNKQNQNNRLTGNPGLALIVLWTIGPRWSWFKKKITYYGLKIDVLHRKSYPEISAVTSVFIRGKSDLVVLKARSLNEKFVDSKSFVFKG